MSEITESLEILEARGINPNWYQQYIDLCNIQEMIIRDLQITNLFD